MSLDDFGHEEIPVDSGTECFETEPESPDELMKSDIAEHYGIAKPKPWMRRAKIIHDND